MKENKVLILMGSDSDRKVVESALPYFNYFGIAVEVKVSSAHRHPEQTAKLAANARENGFKAIVCAAGMAAHLAGVCAAHSDLPVIGVPLSGGALDGLDALLSTVQMPSGIPVATLAIGKAGAINSAVFCARLFSLTDNEIHKKLVKFRNSGSKLKG
ncbi:MAG: 5-(carboxyamino)imidazole ribonucleotide mutase [Calditrichaeota bacterium]|nr:5-(carboxyamino)imidazole ribonucleotide mutase [Calditrichota bacterium]